MRIALSADHAGYELKDVLAAWLGEVGHEVIDLGTNSSDSVDYPTSAPVLGKRSQAARPIAASPYVAQASAFQSPPIGIRMPLRFGERAAFGNLCAHP
jgi:hypothetical protein